MNTLFRTFLACGFATLLAVPARAAEPSSGKELVTKRAKVTYDQAADQKRLAGMPPEELAWEKTLEKCLGDFYLPIYKREKLAGKTTAWDYVKDDPALPRVLLIGDSISRGYTLATRKALAGKANVHRAPENCGPTANGLKKLDLWLGEGHWDVIHFNFGIHDRKNNPETYAQNLEQLVERMQKTGAKLVWASTTPGPADSKDVPPGCIEKLNEVAAGVMQKHGVPTDDLFSLVKPKLAEIQNTNDVHFKEEGYQLLGAQVAKSIEAALKSKK